MSLALQPDRDTFLALAKEYPLVPIWVKVLADRDTPVSAFEKLVGSEAGFLLESVEGGENWGRWSFLGWDPLFTLSSSNGMVTSELDLDADDPVAALGEVAARFRTPDLPGLPPLHSGLVGYLGYDCVRYFEHLPHRPADDRSLPEMSWQGVGSLAAFDRVEQSLTLVRNVIVGDDPEGGYQAAAASIEASLARLGQAQPYPPVAFNDRPALGDQAASTMTRAEFEEAVRSAKESIRLGDAFQIVLSQRLSLDFSGDPFSVYRWLRVINPSPYLFFYRDSRWRWRARPPS